MEIYFGVATELIIFGSLIAFISTSLAWTLFGKPHKWLHYGSLILLGMVLALWTIMAVTAEVTPFSRKPCDDLFSKQENVILLLLQIAALYSSIALLTTLVRRVLKYPTKKLLIVCAPIFVIAVTSSIVLTTVRAENKLECQANWENTLRGPQ